MAHTVEYIHEGKSNSGIGFLMGIVLLMFFMFLMFYYGLPVLKSTLSTPQAPQINVPDKVDVNIKQAK